MSGRRPRRRRGRRVIRLQIQGLRDVVSGILLGGAASGRCRKRCGGIAVVVSGRHPRCSRQSYLVGLDVKVGRGYSLIFSSVIFFASNHTAFR